MPRPGLGSSESLSQDGKRSAIEKLFHPGWRNQTPALYTNTSISDHPLVQYRQLTARNYDACHTCTVRSRLAEAMRLPSGDHAAANTALE
jgi:hypothetical protein